MLDTSAILCVLFGEEGFGQVTEILDTAQVSTSPDPIAVLLPFMALMEVEYWLLRRVSSGDLQRSLLLVESWPVTVRESDPNWRREAARVKSRGRLSVADAWIAALALTHDAELVHKDPEFDQVADLRSFRLPYRTLGS